MDDTLKSIACIQKQDIFDSDLGLIARYIGSAVMFDSRNSKVAFDILLKSGKPEDLLSSRLKQYEEEIGKEIRFLDL